MKRRIPGLYLVRVERIQYRWDKQKPFYAVRLAVVEPLQLAGTSLPGRLWCTERALWKLSWFLRDFGYDAELLGRDELDEKRMVGLTGVVKLSHATVNGRTYLNLDAFASAGEWDEYSHLSRQRESPMADRDEPEVA
jgi:hypothetical protein